MLFYTFERIKRAYIVTGWQNAHDGEPVALPGVDGTLALMYMTKGGRKSAVQVLIESYKTEGKSRYYE